MQRTLRPSYAQSKTSVIAQQVKTSCRITLNPSKARVILDNSQHWLAVALFLAHNARLPQARAHLCAAQHE
tara:strand:- start:409 stop:621 length:213 start_codon:yes stop_codon:yes gene_type:complete